MSFGVFGKCFCKHSFSSLPTYKDAIFQIIEATPFLFFILIYRISFGLLSLMSLFAVNVSPSAAGS